MTALGKALAAGTLAFGLATLAGGTAGASSPYDSWDGSHKNHDSKYDSRGHDRYGKSHDFYRLSYWDQKRLCEDDDYWENWSWMYRDDSRDDYCHDFWYGNGGRYETDHHDSDYSRDEHYKDSYSARYDQQEKNAYFVEASNRDSDNYGRNHDDNYGHDDWNKQHDGDSYDNGYAYRDDSSNYKAEGYQARQTSASVNADVDNRVVVNNYVSVRGDNNNVYNNVSVSNNASVDQKASASQVKYASVEYNDSTDRGYGSEHADSGYKAAAYSEKSQSSEVKQDTSYNLNEHFSQSGDNGRDHAYYNKDGGNRWCDDEEEDKCCDRSSHYEDEDNCDDYSSDGCDD